LALSYTIDLSGRVAFVTGASSGLGMQFARTLAQAGAAVVLAGRRIERLKTLRADIEAAGGDAHVVSLDVTEPQDVKAAVAHAETEMGAIDILVNNSGVSVTQKLVDVTPEDYDFVMDTNVRGAFFVAQEVGKRMIARAQGAAPGTFTGGRIVNIASIAGLKAISQIGVYAMSKAAVIHMTRAMALEWGRWGINVTAICPGYVDTEINHHHWETDGGRKLIDTMPRKRLGKPADLDVVLMMLCSNESHFVNGTVIQVDDGFGVS
jgi:NAD(P)-dependent dehydrogenase (short-subunit alcohol dehydrogenase family)